MCDGELLRRRRRDVDRPVQRPGDGGRRPLRDLAAGDAHSRTRHVKFAGAVGVVPYRGNCTVVGWYQDASNARQPFVEDEVNGSWGSAAKLPGQSSQGVFSPQSTVSCWSAGNCVTGGVVATSTGLRAIVSVESPAASVALTTNTATVTFGQEQSATLAIRVKPKTGGTPAGTVTIKAGTTALAVVTLKRGKATWTFPPKKLPPAPTSSPPPTPALTATTR
jgi:hypothetical protein